MLKKGVSIIICTFNGKAKLEKTLQHLALQKITIPSEIILVDNASTDGSKEYADTWWAKQGSLSISFRSFTQPIAGKSYAQDLGYNKAQYSYLLVCDDDNWLCDSYVQTAFETMEQHPEIGALGGWCDAVFESEKPEWFDTYAKFFAVSKQGDETGDITHKKGCLYGAGMVLCKSHWLQLKALGFEHLLSCRKGDSLSSGGDTEYCYALRLLGYKIWYNKDLFFTHYMTNGRLSLKYLSRLRKAMSYSNFVLWSYKDLLNASIRTKSQFIKEATSGFPSSVTNQLRYLWRGDFDQKETARLFFRNSYYLLFLYSEYKNNIASVKSWLKNNNP